MHEQQQSPPAAPAASSRTTATIPRCRHSDSNEATLSRPATGQPQQRGHAAAPAQFEYIGLLVTFGHLDQKLVLDSMESIPSDQHMRVPRDPARQVACQPDPTGAD